MIARAESFYAAVDAFTSGEARNSTTIDSSVFKGEVAARHLERVGAIALEAVGRNGVGLRLDLDFEALGSNNVVRALDTADCRYAMRLRPPGHDDGYQIVECIARDLSVSMGVRTPRIYAAHTDMPPETRSDFAFTLEEFLPGEQVSVYQRGHLDKNIVPLMLKKVGAALAVMHGHTIDNGYGFFDVSAAKRGVLEGQHDSYRDRVTAGLRPVLATILDSRVLEQTQVESLDEYFRHADIFGQLGAGGAKLLHGELTLYNMKFGDDTNDPYIIDFGETQAGPAIHDLASVGAYLVRNGFDDGMDDVIEGYIAQGGILPSNFGEGFKAIRLRYMVSIVAGQLAFLRNNPTNLTVPPYLKRAISSLRTEVALIGA